MNTLIITGVYFRKYGVPFYSKNYSLYKKLKINCLKFQNKQKRSVNELKQDLEYGLFTPVSVFFLAV